MYSLGALVPLSITVRDSAGVPTATTPVVATITLPDGTTATPAVSTSSTGVYFVDYAAPQAGRYEVYWTTSGTITSAFGPDAFEVKAASRAPIVGLTEAKAHLDLTGTTANDDEILSMLSGISDAVEAALGRPGRRRVVVDTFSGRWKYAVTLRSSPCPCLVCAPYRLLTLTSVVEDGITLTSSDYTLDPVSGVLNRGSFAQVLSWSDRSLANVVVTYVAGYSGTPPWLRLAVLRAIENVWTRSQQRPHPGFGQAPDTDFSTGGPKFTLPYAVQALLEPHIAPGF